LCKYAFLLTITEHRLVVTSSCRQLQLMCVRNTQKTPFIARTFVGGERGDWLCAAARWRFKRLETISNS